MAPMVSSSKKKDFQIDSITNDLKNEKNSLLQIRKYIEKILNMLEETLVKK